MEARRRAHLESCCTATELKQSRKQLRFVEYGNIANVKIKGQILATTVQGSEFQFGRITNPTELRFSGEYLPCHARTQTRKLDYRNRLSRKRKNAARHVSQHEGLCLA